MKPVNPIGKPCKVLLLVNSNSIGQAEIKVEGTSILINAMSNKGVEINKGETALVIKHITEKKLLFNRTV